MTVPLRVVLQMEEAQKRARDLSGRFANYEPVMRGPVRRLIRSAIVAQFRTRGRFGGTPWAPLARTTRALKRKHPEWRQEPMRRTDRLYHSLTRTSHPDQQEIIDKQGYTIRSLVRYARFHQSTAPRSGRLPRRPIIPDELPQDVMTRLRNLVRGYLVAGELS